MEPHTPSARAQGYKLDGTEESCQSVTKIYDQYATMAVASWHILFSRSFKFVKRTLLTVTVRLSV